jgi:hypothetical protein
LPSVVTALCLLLLDRCSKQGKPWIIAFCYNKIYIFLNYLLTLG